MGPHSNPTAASGSPEAAAFWHQLQLTFRSGLNAAAWILLLLLLVWLVLWQPAQADGPPSRRRW